MRCRKYNNTPNFNNSKHGKNFAYIVRRLCDVEGKIKINRDKAEYNSKKYQYDRETDTEYFIPVGILFQMETEDKMNLHFINADSFSAFCGIQATLEGIWIRQ